MGDQKPCVAVAGEAGSPLKQSHYETHADPLAHRVPAVSLRTSGCVSLSPSGSGIGPGAVHTHSECFRKPRRLSGVAVDLRLAL